MVCLALDLVGSWVELGFSVGTEVLLLVKVVVLPVVMYRCESWTIKKG